MSLDFTKENKFHFINLAGRRPLNVYMASTVDRPASQAVGIQLRIYVSYSEQTMKHLIINKL